MPNLNRKEASNTQLAAREHDEVVTQPTEFSRIFEAHHGMIFRTAYRITGNAADAEDVLQTIFLRLVRQQQSGSAAPAVEQEESYLRRAAVNASLDIIRRRATSPTVSLNEAVTATPAAASDSVLKDCLRRALRTLSERSAEIFAFRYFEGLTNQQIASALNISQVLVGVSLHRSRRQLQQEIRTCMGGTQ